MSKSARRRQRRNRKLLSRFAAWCVEGHHLRWILLSLFSIIGISCAYVYYLDYTIRTQFEGKRWAVPAKVYARALELYPGLTISADNFEQELKLMAYQPMKKPTRPGTYFRKATKFQIFTRQFNFWDGKEPSVDIVIEFDGQSIADITHAITGESIPLVRLDPVIIGRIYPSHTEDRILVKLKEVPPLLVDTLIATEDRDFYTHHGVAPKAIARALWANLRAGGTVQGGSTLTQQLVKNFFLSNERTLWRKLNEAIMSLLLEYHYGKDEILEAYLNEIFLGQDGKRSIHGFGLASHFYFEKPLGELDSAQVALLVGIVKGPSYYSPRRFEERATERRNLVLDLAVEQGYISHKDGLDSKSSPLGVTSRARSSTTNYPAFMDLVRRQLKRDYKEEDLNSEGLQIFTTLDPIIQERSELALASRLENLGKAKDTKDAKLQAASVLVSVENGEVLSMVGGRNPRFAGFNRALDAVRHIGSLVKPAIYLTALKHPKQFTLVTPLDDSPLEHKLENGDIWAPLNFDKKFHDRVPLYMALARSYNVSTARLGLDIGVVNVVETLRRLGVERPIQPYPSVLLGAVSLSPFEVTQVYHSLASGGFRTPLRAIRAVLTARGEPLQRYPLSIQQVFNTSTVYILNHALREVTRQGTGRGIYRTLPLNLDVAGKTGTSDDLRDSWFAGFTGDKLGVVWLGKDNNESSGLTGSSGALRVWRDIFESIDIGQSLETQPDDVEMVELDTETYLRGGVACDSVISLPFIEGSAPQEYASCAGSRESENNRGFNWFKGLFE